MAAPAGNTGILLAYQPTFLIPAMYLVGALLAGAVVIAVVRRRMRQGEARPDAGTELSRYRALYEQGAISEQEFHSLRALLGGELHRAIHPPKAPGPPAASQTKPDASPGSDVPNTPSEGIRPLE